MPNSRGASARVPWRAFLAAALAALLAGCVTMPQQPAADADTAATAYSSDAMLQLLAGQFALQAGDVGSAATHFTRAAALLPDPAVAEEATRLAVAARDWALARSALERWTALAPGQPGQAQVRGWIALGEGRPAEAESDLAALVADGSEAGWRLVAQALIGASEPAIGAELLGRLATPERLGSREANWIAVSQLAFRLDDKALAERLATTARKRFASGATYAWSARIALDRGDRKAALALYADAVRHDPANLRLRGAYAALLAENGDDRGAARILAAGPQDDATLAARAAYLARADDSGALAALYREMAAEPGPRSGRRLYLLGQLAEMLEKRQQALDWYRDVPADDERAIDARTRSIVVLDQLGRTDEALRGVRQLQQDAVGERDRLAGAYLLEAEILGRHGRIAEARQTYARALEALPDDGTLLYARALMEVEHGDPAAGQRDLRRLVELRPDDAEALNALGYTLADHARPGDPALAEARDLVARALELKPDEPAIMDSMGWVHYRMGRLDAALPLLRAAWAKQHDAEIAAHLGEVLWASGEHAEARRIWQEGLREDKENKVLCETMRRLAP
ncbi:MAG: tetratricopeptide repeat protein [Xanthomonadales bacterium]|nr:tetratricopeptide repeat protein [Xanthomonadales bacterium]